MEQCERAIFARKGIQSITLPGTLREIGSGTLPCDGLKWVHVKDSCIADVRHLVKEQTKILPLRPKTVLGLLLWDLRKLGTVVVPDGIVSIGSYWFYGSHVQSVTLPNSVERIGAEAFCDCTELIKIVFLPNSKLEQICERSFCNTSLEETVIPSSVTVIREEAFRDCRRLKSVTF